MDNKDYYALLGIHPTSTLEVIKAAYRRAARKYHPDVSKEPQAEERFKAINEAYEILSNPLKREKYDRQYQAWQIEIDSFSFSSQQQNQAAQQNSKKTPHPTGKPTLTKNKAANESNRSGLSSLLDALFGTAKPAAKGGKPVAQVASIRLSLEDVFVGATKMIKLPSGESIQVKIPKGIEDGKKIRLPGKGLQQSDLHLKIQLLEHPLFKLKEQDLYLTLPITPWEAALGGRITIPGLGGPLQLTIPTSTHSGQKLRLKGQGMVTPELIGDLIITIQIETPPITNETEREFYLKMAQHFQWSPREEFQIG